MCQEKSFFWGSRADLLAMLSVSDAGGGLWPSTMGKEVGRCDDGGLDFLPFLVGQKQPIFQTTTITGVRIFLQPQHMRCRKSLFDCFLLDPLARLSKQQLCIIMTLGGHLHHDHRLRAIDRGNGSPTDCS